MIHKLRVPGEATRREYAVYVMVATPRGAGAQTVYVGKTGDNRDGCNPLISRAGNHFSYNTVHSQARNRIPDAENHDFVFFYTTFGVYTPKVQSREGLNVINAMERELIQLVQEHKRLGGLLHNKARSGRAGWPRDKRESHDMYTTADRKRQLRKLVTRAAKVIRDKPTAD